MKLISGIWMDLERFVEFGPNSSAWWVSIPGFGTGASRAHAAQKRYGTWNPKIWTLKLLLLGLQSWVDKDWTGDLSRKNMQRLYGIYQYQYQYQDQYQYQYQYQYTHTHYIYIYIIIYTYAYTRWHHDAIWYLGLNRLSREMGNALEVTKLERPQRPDPWKHTCPQLYKDLTARKNVQVGSCGLTQNLDVSSRISRWESEHLHLDHLVLWYYDVRFQQICVDVVNPMPWT